MTQQTNLLIKEHDKWIELTLNRPDSFNALSKDMLNELQHAMHDIALRDDLSCVVINAKGKAFCAGHDLKEIRANVDDAFYSKLFQQCSQFMQSIVDLPIPVVAQVQGIATAAGCQLVASCDLAIASDTARFAVSASTLACFVLPLR